MEKVDTSWWTLPLRSTPRWRTPGAGPLFCGRWTGTLPLFKTPSPLAGGACRAHAALASGGAGSHCTREQQPLVAVRRAGRHDGRLSGQHIALHLAVWHAGRRVRRRLR
eukprot:scaffold1421_cov113-Isochrysis_galbana.AAC.2